MEQKPWELQSSEPVLETPWFTMTKNHYHIPDLDKDKEYYMLHEKTGVNIIAKTEEGKFLVIKQYRPGIKKVTTEFPAGYLEKGDVDHLARAKQELLEETGYGGGEWYAVGVAHSMPNRAEKEDYCFLALGVTRVAEQSLDSDESILVELLTQTEIEDKILSSEISCTTCTAQWYRALLFEKNL